MSMTKEDYEARRKKIFAQLVELDNKYIKENTTIAPGCRVYAAGKMCYLKKYKVVGGYIYPVLLPLNKNGVHKESERLHVGKGCKLVKI